MKLLHDYEISDLGAMGMEVPRHTREAIDGYLLNGWMPGGFLTAVICGDLFRAVDTADTANRQMLWAVARWISHNAPRESWGSAQIMRDWMEDKNGVRSRHRTDREKKAVWNSLTQTCEVN